MELPINSAAVIAGGASRRMGQNKALLLQDGVPLVAGIVRVLQPLFENIVVITADKTVAQAAAVPSIPDVYPGKGPLGGIHTALRHFRAPVFCVACDLPFLNREAVRFLCTQLEDCDAVLPRIDGWLQPLHAVYAPSCLPIFEQELRGERVRPIEQVLAPFKVHFIEEAAWRVFDASLKNFKNLNTPDEARAAGFSL